MQYAIYIIPIQVDMASYASPKMIGHEFKSMYSILHSVLCPSCGEFSKWIRPQFSPTLPFLCDLF